MSEQKSPGQLLADELLLKPKRLDGGVHCGSAVHNIVKIGDWDISKSGH